MPIEKYEIVEIENLGKGRQTQIIYRDCFDPDEFMQIVTNPSEKPELRHKCAVRLLSAKVITREELDELVKNGRQKP